MGSTRCRVDGSLRLPARLPSGPCASSCRAVGAPDRICRSAPACSRSRNAPVEIGASALQIFSDNPTAWRRRPEPPPEAAAFKRRLAELDIGPLAIHAAYLVNLAGPDETLVRALGRGAAPRVEPRPRFRRERSSTSTPAHIAARASRPACDRLVDGLARALAEAPDGPDRAARRGGELVRRRRRHRRHAGGAGRRPRRGGGRGLDGRLRFCLDTAHLWGAGYDMSEPGGVDASWRASIA